MKTQLPNSLQFLRGYIPLSTPPKFTTPHEPSTTSVTPGFPASGVGANINMSNDKISQDVHLTNLAVDPAIEKEAPTEHTEELQNAARISLTWKSWMVVFVSCFAIMSQVFVVVAAGSVIAFIIRDLGDAPLAGWIIQGPLLMQAVLSPIVGRLSDVLDRKYMASIPPLIAFVGAAVSARANSMATLVGGGILIGITLATIAIVQAIPSEVLPLKYRALANGFAFLAGAVGGIVGVLGAGGLTNSSPSGWVGGPVSTYESSADIFSIARHLLDASGLSPDDKPRIVGLLLAQETLDAQAINSQYRMGD